MKLDELRAGEYGRITAVGGMGALRRRLLDMGLTPGTRVFIRKVAPFGDPIELYLRGYEFTLRKEDAAIISVVNIPGEEGHGHAHRFGRQPEQRQNDAVQPTDGQQPACRQFPRRHRGKKGRPA